jgi:hypothetical protein
MHVAALQYTPLVLNSVWLTSVAKKVHQWQLLHPQPPKQLFKSSKNTDDTFDMHTAAWKQDLLTTLMKMKYEVCSAGNQFEFVFML